MLLQSPPGAEAIERFSCFGGSCAVLVQGAGPAGSADEAAIRVRRRLLGWHSQFSRFDPASELSRLNASSDRIVPVSPIMARFLNAALGAAQSTSGLVDPTLVTELEAAGYERDFDRQPLALAEALRLAPHRQPARARSQRRWSQMSVDQARGLLMRTPGVRLDSGGVAKGLFGDVLASLLSGHRSFAVDAAGDVRFGGSAGLPRSVQVASPFEKSVLHVFELVRGAAATSGIGRRSWLDKDGLPAHHLLDPSTGRPAFTGVVQATALAPAALEAEVLAKAALLSGPGGARDWLPHGGLIVYDSGRFEVIDSSDDGLLR